MRVQSKTVCYIKEGERQECRVLHIGICEQKERDMFSRVTFTYLLFAAMLVSKTENLNKTERDSLME